MKNKIEISEASSSSKLSGNWISFFFSERRRCETENFSHSLKSSSGFWVFKDHPRTLTHCDKKTRFCPKMAKYFLSQNFWWKKLTKKVKLAFFNLWLFGPKYCFDTVWPAWFIMRSLGESSATMCAKKKIQWAARKLHSVACKMTNAQDFLSYDSNLGIYRHVQKSTDTSSSWIFSYVIHYVWKLPVKLTVIVFEAMKVIWGHWGHLLLLRPTEIN